MCDLCELLRAHAKKIIKADVMPLRLLTVFVVTFALVISMNTYL